MKDQNAANNYLKDGDNWTARVARLSLPILLAAAKDGQEITYKELALRLNHQYGEVVKRRWDLYGGVVGRIGASLEILSKTWGERIPPLNAIVVNAKTGLPGHGAEQFVKHYIYTSCRRTKSGNRDKLAIDDLLREAIRAVHDYPWWDKVAEYFGISQLPRYKKKELKIHIPKIPSPRGNHEESENHKKLKDWTSKNPKFFSAFGKFKSGIVEVTISSGDRLDAFLANHESRLAIEVKASNAPDDELFRGVFQCIKYRATLRAMQLADGEAPNAQAVLVTTRKVPSEVKSLAERLQVTILIAPEEAEA
ncbi:hypothetical protein ACSSZE_13260 [Acidithiobacillus caldus]